MNTSCFLINLMDLKMKKIQLLLILIIFINSTINLIAQVPRKYVVAEEFTGIDCSGCPNAATILDNLMGIKDKLIVVAYHENHYSASNPIFNNPNGQKRLSYYGVSGLPTVIMDGTSTMPYPQDIADFESKYTQRLAIPSPVSIGLTLNQLSGKNYKADITVTKQGALPTGTLKLMVAVTERNIDYVWMTMKKLNYVERLLLPDANGTIINMTNNSQTNSFTFTLNPKWQSDYCDLVVFVQNEATKEILQAEKVSCAPIQTNDVSADLISGFDKGVSCPGSIAPAVRIRNSGTSNLTSAVLKYSINGGTKNTYNWTGNLAPYQQVTVTLPKMIVSLNPQPALNPFLVVTSNPNGKADEDNTNDSVMLNIKSASVTGNKPGFRLKTHQWSSTVNWALYNESGAVIDKSAALSNNKLYTKTFNLSPGCYKMIVNDGTGNGLYSPYGPADCGFFTFLDGKGVKLVDSISKFGYFTQVLFNVESPTGIEDANELEKITVFPNPTQGNVHIDFIETTTTITIYNLMGEKLQELTTDENVVIDLSNYKNGIYLMKITTKDGMIIRKLNKIK
jgi:hypothetical protein